MNRRTFLARVSSALAVLPWMPNVIPLPARWCGVDMAAADDVSCYVYLDSRELTRQVQQRIISNHVNGRSSTQRTS